MRERARRGPGRAALLSWFGRHVAVLVGIAFLVLYMWTLAPGLLPADAGEFQVVGAVLGVAHPPGFALYTLASWLISRVLAWTGVPPATAINFLSALLAAGALALLCRATERLTGSRLAGLGAACLLGLSTTFWAQATTANIRMPAALATAWALERIAAYHEALVASRVALASRQSGGSPGPALARVLPGREVGGTPSRTPARALALLSLALGLGVAHHASLVFVMLLLGIYALSLEPAALRRPWWPMLAGLLPFVGWLYFPLRAGAFGAPAGIATPAGFLEHVLARGFAGDLFFFANAAALPERLRVFGNILSFEFNAPVLVLMALGAAAAIWRDRRLGLALLAATAAHVVVSMTYRAPQTVEYLLPAYVLMGAWAGMGAAEGKRWLDSIAHGRGPGWLPAAIGGAVVALAAAGQAWAALPSYGWLARDDSTRAYAETLLDDAPPGAVILSTWHWATPLWYLQQVEGRRPDVRVQYVVPQGASLARNWIDAIAANVPHSPVLVTSYFAAEYEALPAAFIPLGPAWEVRAGLLRQPPPGLTGGRSLSGWDFLGYRLESISAQAVVLTAAWRAPAADSGGAKPDISAFVHLLAPDGSLHSQEDIRHAGASFAEGDVLLDRFTLALRPDAAAGPYQLVAGVYWARDGAPLTEIQLTTVQIPPQPFPTSGIAAGALPFGNEIWLEGSTVRPAAPVHPGDTIVVELHFLAARPITTDYTVSVGLVGPNFRWQTLSDATPAGGAIPTLKWIAGSRVTDTHVLTIPPDAEPGVARLMLTLYDAFTQRGLPVLDSLLAAQGPAVPLGEVEVVGR